MGQKIKNIGIVETKMIIDMNGITIGIYIATIINGKNTINFKAIVIKKQNAYS